MTDDTPVTFVGLCHNDFADGPSTQFLNFGSDVVIGRNILAHKFPPASKQGKQTSFFRVIMTGKQSQEGSFTDEAVSYGQTTGPGETIPVIDDSKVPAEGMDKLDSRTADSNAQLGINPVS